VKKKSYWNRIADAAQLHSEPLPGLSFVEIASDCRVLIERHQGVMKYDRQQICVKTTYGCILVGGCNLVLTEMTHAQLVITGRIESVLLKRRNG